MEPCPSCRREIDINARPCPHCGNPEPFSESYKKVLYSRYKRESIENQKKLREIFRNNFGIIPEDEKKLYLSQIKEEITKKNFWLAFSISTKKMKKSQKEAEIQIKKISDEIGVSDEFEKWRKKKDINGKIFAFIVVILIPLIWIIYKWINN